MANRLPLYRALFFLKHGYVDGGNDLKAQAGLDLVVAEGLNGVLQHQLLLGNVDAELLLEPLGDFLGGDGPEELAARPGPGRELHHALLELFGGLLRQGLLAGLLGLFRLLFQVHGVDGVRRGGNGHLPGQEEIPGVALGDLHHLALLSLAFDVLL